MNEYYIRLMEDFSELIQSGYAQTGEKSMTDVLCCCNPSNEMGSIEHADGLKAGLELKNWVDEDGQRGTAFSSHGFTDAELKAAGVTKKKKKKKKKKKRTWEK
jgi:hypothetical protein